MSYTVHPSHNHSATQYIILSSGLGGHGSFWKPQIEFLQQQFNVITYDQEGCHADAVKLAENYSMRDMAQQVLEIMQSENLQDCHFIGHALGGHIGAELAILLEKNQKKLLSLTSINAWDKLDPHTQKCFEARISLLKHAGESAYVKAQALFLYPPAWISEHIQQLHQAEDIQLQDFPPKENVLARLSALQKFQITAEHQQALQNTPIHFIANRDDFLVPYKKTLDLKNIFSHAEVSIFESGAHASTVTESECINQALFNFLKKSL